MNDLKRKDKGSRAFYLEVVIAINVRENDTLLIILREKDLLARSEYVPQV